VGLHEFATGTADIVHIPAKELLPSVEDVTRCACGPDYDPRDSVRTAIEELIPIVLADVDPRFTTAALRVTAPQAKGLALSDSRILEIALPAGDPVPAALVAALCTVGTVDERLEGLIESRGPLDAWIAQGIAMAQLELLEQRCMRSIMEAGRAAGLSGTSYLEPDVCTQSQTELFASVDAEGVGVQLTEYGTMEPRLSYSFWVPLHDDTEPEA